MLLGLVAALTVPKTEEGPAMKVVLLALLFAGLGGCAIASPPLKTARLVSSSPPILIHTGMAMTPVVEPA
ncbi:MAG: hypothetical protein DME12_20070 [Candidatus Rokuibacteriota bacterium]|nr:MAG: hypothetical protein DME12_20070 [Candidatus Rokubacteria bacterium]